MMDGRRLWKLSGGKVLLHDFNPVLGGVCITPRLFELKVLAMVVAMLHR